MLKKIFFLILLFFCVPFISYAEDSDWTIDSFDVRLEIMPSGELSVTETIAVDFFVEKHGIFRYIPIKYKDNNGFNYKLDLNLQSIYNENNEQYMYTDNINGSDFYIKIGDPDVTITGKHIYNIKYIVKNGIRFFKDHDELYWNATGTEWPVPIKSASAQIIYPDGVEQENLQLKCFTGSMGSTNENCIIGSLANTVAFSTADLPEYSGLTVVFGMPKNIVAEPTATDKVKNFLFDNLGFLIPIVVFALLFYFWYTKGREPKLKGTIIAQYETFNNLTPVEVGSLIDSKIQMRDISAEIVNLAVKKYIKIKETEKGAIFKSKTYELIKLESQDSYKLKQHEKDLLEYLFGYKSSVKIDDLKNKFYKDLPKLRKQIFSQLVEYGYFLKSPEAVLGIYYGIGILLLILSVFGLAFGRPDIFAGLILSGLLFLIFANFMPQKTTKGGEAYWHILGLKEFIGVAEKYRVKFQEKENMFETLLPYAMIFGLAEKWAKEFKDIYNQQPEWYESSGNMTFNSLLLVHSLNSFQTTSNSALRSTPQSSGSSGFSSGGSSGGGFGGGGGGSW